jgi:hypothetical protein
MKDLHGRNSLPRRQQDILEQIVTKEGTDTGRAQHKRRP